MKKIILALGLFFLANTLKAQEAPPMTVTIVPDPKAKATREDVVDKQASQIRFETTTIDYGIIEHNADGNRVFKFKNTGKSPLVINRVSSSCGCLVPTYPKDPIMPGKKGEIMAHYDTNRIGFFTKTLTVYSNSVTPTVVLTIKGEVKPDPEPAGTQAATH